MEVSENEITNVSENDMLKMLSETSQLVVSRNAQQLSTAAVAAQNSNALASNVEFWKWMSRNYSGSGIFDSAESMQQYIAQSAGKEEWVIKQLQGKGYEWDWMLSQRGNIQNVLNTYDAGDVANRAASDVTERSLITGNSSEYQMKAYTSKTNPHLQNTPKDMTVVTNAEKVDVVKANGYENVEEFQDTQIIKKATNERLDQIKSGKAYTSYNLSNVAGTMAKAGLIGCIIGIGTETVSLYNTWKSGQITDEEYLKNVLKAGGNAGITAGATSGIMIPVSAAITAAGASTLITIPVAIVVGGVVNKVVAPCFGRGKYREILSDAKYYQSFNFIYEDLTKSMNNAAQQYYHFVYSMEKQRQNHELMKRVSMEMNKELKDIYDSI